MLGVRIAERGDGLQRIVASRAGKDERAYGTHERFALHCGTAIFRDEKTLAHDADDTPVARPATVTRSVYFPIQRVTKSSMTSASAGSTSASVAPGFR